MSKGEPMKRRSFLKKAAAGLAAGTVAAPAIALDADYAVPAAFVTVSVNTVGCTVMAAVVTATPLVTAPMPFSCA